MNNRQLVSPYCFNEHWQPKKKMCGYLNLNLNLNLKRNLCQGNGLAKSLHSLKTLRKSKRLLFDAIIKTKQTLYRSLDNDKNIPTLPL